MNKTKTTNPINADIFEDLFVLELANNHWGRIDRGLKIIREFAQVVRFNSVRATIKLQFRDVDNFIHKDYKSRSDIRYIKKTLDTRLDSRQYAELVANIKDQGCLTSATPFDEASVDLCEELNLDIIKIASSDINDWFLIERIAKTGKPVSFSTGGSSLKGMDDLVNFFSARGIPFAVNHCVSIYPAEDHELELNQVDFLRDRYPNATIGLSTHEYHSWDASILIAYAKGARTFERHIDVQADEIPVSPYCSTPDQIDLWFRSFKKAKEMCGGSPRERRVVPQKEIKYLDALVRGVYAKRALKAGYVLHHARMQADFYLAIPLVKGQLSCREVMNGEVLKSDLNPDQPLLIDDLESKYAESVTVRKELHDRGI
jgi:N-acetylneuraminate synthase